MIWTDSSRFLRFFLGRSWRDKKVKAKKIEIKIKIKKSEIFARNEKNNFFLQNKKTCFFR